jgi:hypothetical protein
MVAKVASVAWQGLWLVISVLTLGAFLWMVLAP